MVEINYSANMAKTVQNICLFSREKAPFQTTAGKNHKGKVHDLFILWSQKICNILVVISTRLRW